ncbi:helix-turn-helix domain-containing protein [Streptomyces syringium]|uniref:helix-turn-helix domain-containing protein n=1 Tax=Streptomyces syringium TaxID=76729 RepID=UPI0034145033
MQTRKNGKKQASPMQLTGALLRQLRMNAKLTQCALAERLCVSEETIASIEQGRRSLMPDMAEQLDRILGTGGVLAVAVANLPGPQPFPDRVKEFMRYEREAIAISSYETGVIPGLLQTEAYARAVFHTAVPAVGEDEIERRVSFRLGRQAVLHREPPITASFVISEPIVNSRIGGREVMRDQVRHVRTCADLPGVSIQVLPHHCESHAGLSGPFVLLETPDHQRLAYTEAQRTSHLFTDAEEVSILTWKYGTLRMQALNAEETKILLTQLLGET